MSLWAEVARFKDWAATQAKDFGEWECDYPRWPALREAAEAVLAGAPLRDVDIDLILYTLARDNECELIRGMLEEHPSNGMCVARSGIMHPDRDARWQIADFLSTCDNEEARSLLRKLVVDHDEYVRRRALLASAQVDPEFAEMVAVEWLSVDFEYARLAALTVLDDLRSPQLRHAMDRLEDDPSPYVRRKLAEIEDAAAANATVE